MKPKNSEPQKDPNRAALVCTWPAICTFSDVLLWMKTWKISFRISWQTFTGILFFIWVWMGWGKDWNLYHSELLWLSWVKILLRRRFTHEKETLGSGAQAMPHMNTLWQIFWRETMPTQIFPLFSAQKVMHLTSHSSSTSPSLPSGVTETQHGYLLNLLSHFHTVC